MTADLSPLQSLRREILSSPDALVAIETRFAAIANSNASHNTNLHSYTIESPRLAEQLPNLFPDSQNRSPLYCIPISIKDCFDVARSFTSCASRFYAEINPPAADFCPKRPLDAEPSLPVRRTSTSSPTVLPARMPTTATASSPATQPC
jgi:Asp-tRNA(Asn)/Glu-tRNA(Gln) amidotransferase A subunit family amidase